MLFLTWQQPTISLNYLVTMVTCWSGLWCECTVTVWLGCLRVQLLDTNLASEDIFCSRRMSNFHLCKTLEHSSVFFLFPFLLWIFCSNVLLFIRTYIYSYEPKSFRVKVVLSAAVSAHMGQLLQTMFLPGMEFLEYYGIFLRMFRWGISRDFTLASLCRN